MKHPAKQLALALIDLIDGKNMSASNAAETFIHFLSDRHELKRLDDVIRAIDVVWREKYGAATVTIETAHPLTATLKKQLEKVAAGAEIKENVNKELIGGACVRIDDHVIDGSIAGMLNQLKVSLYQ